MTDTEMLDFVIEQEASVGYYPVNPKTPWMVITDIYESYGLTLREAIQSAMNENCEFANSLPR